MKQTCKKTTTSRNCDRRQNSRYLLSHIHTDEHCYAYEHCHLQIHTHARTFNGPFSGNTQVSRYQKGKPIWILLKQETVSGSGIHWAVCKSATRSRQITTPAPHHSVFYRPDALPATQPTGRGRGKTTTSTTDRSVWCHKVTLEALGLGCMSVSREKKRKPSYSVNICVCDAAVNRITCTDLFIAWFVKNCLHFYTGSALQFFFPDLKSLMCSDDVPDTKSMLLY